MNDVEDLIEIQFDVPKHCHGWRVDRFIQAQVPRLSRSRIQKMIRAQKELGGADLRPASRVQGGTQLRLIRPAPVEPDVPRAYQILYQNEGLIAIDKPAGLPVHATARFHRNTLTAFLREDFVEPIPHLVHRLDKETSGVLLLATDKEVEVALKNDLAARKVHKRYLAIVKGQVPQSGVIDAPIGSDIESGIRIKMGVRDDGQVAETYFERVVEKSGYSLVFAEPRTGRQHQIRVHLASIGYPIVGDKLYGDDPNLLLEYLETGWTDSLAEKLLLPRQALHAHLIELTHPVLKEKITIESPLPDELQKFWDSI